VQCLVRGRQKCSDPANLSEGRDLAARKDVHPIGLFYRNKEAECYDQYSVRGSGLAPAEKVKALEKIVSYFEL